jgi:jumonji domain-containing protein 7
MGDEPVNVAITPHGNADSVLTLDDSGNNMIFVKPYETSEPFSSVIDAISSQELCGRGQGGSRSDIRYAQTQNDNLRNEYSALFSDVPRDIPFARIALQKSPDAVNFWLGNSCSTTALHKDNYENIYVQVLGKKHFVLLPPVEAACVNERAVLAATYAPRNPHGYDSDSDKYTGEAIDNTLVPHIDTPDTPTYVPFCTWDPDNPSVNSTPFSHLSEPLRVTLEEGDMLYLPAMWYHKVSQSCNEEGICCAVNYWYDLDFGGGFWSMAGFVRGVGLLAAEEEEERESEMKR